MSPASLLAKEKDDHRLSVDSTMDQLNEHIKTCMMGSYSVGFTGNMINHDRLKEVQNLNMIGMADVLKYIAGPGSDLKGVYATSAITGRTRSVTPMHLEDLGTIKMNSHFLKYNLNFKKRLF